MKVIVLLTSIFLFSVHIALSAASPTAFITVDGTAYQTAKEASTAIKDYSHIVLSSGVHIGELEVTANDVFITGESGSIVEITEAYSRGFFLISGQRVSIENIHCQGSTEKNKGACIRHNGRDLNVYNSHFYFSGAAILDIASAGRLNIDSSTFVGGGEGRNKAVIDASSPNLTIFNSQMRGAGGGAHLIKAKSSNTKVLRSLLYASDSTGRLIDLPFGGELVIESSLLAQSAGAGSSQVISYGSSTMGRTREHRLDVKRNLILLEREKGSQFLFGRISAETPFDISENIFVGEFKDSQRFASENLVFIDRKSARMSSAKLPDYTKVSDFINYYQLLHGQ